MVAVLSVFTTAGRLMYFVTRSSTLFGDQDVFQPESTSLADGPVGLMLAIFLETQPGSKSSASMSKIRVDFFMVMFALRCVTISSDSHSTIHAPFTRRSPHLISCLATFRSRHQPNTIVALASCSGGGVIRETGCVSRHHIAGQIGPRGIQK
jgi:hypothetical protein